MEPDSFWKVITSPSGFSEHWTMIGGMWGVVIGLISTTVSIIGLVIVYLGFKRTRIQISLGQSAETSRMFIEVMDHWNTHYKIRNELIGSEPTSLAEIEGKFGSDYKEFLKTEYWREKIRPLLNFYEFLGVIIENYQVNKGAMKRQIFTLVTVDVPDDISLSNFTVDDLRIYQRLTPYISYLRKYYRKDIYEYYDKYLLKEYMSYLRDEQEQDRFK
jgi:hypothetical protein